MRVLFGIALGVILITIFIVAYGKTKDLFAPICFFAFYQFIRYVPVIIYNNEEAFFIVLTDKTLLPTFLFETLFVFSVVFGYSLIKKKNHKNSSKTEIPRRSVSIPKIIDIPIQAVFIIFILGFASRVYLIYKSGGLMYVLRNMGNAYMALSTNSNGYILALGNLMTLALLMLIFKISFAKRKKRLIIILIAMIFLSMVSFLVYSARSPALEILLVAIFGYHYLIRKIKVSFLFKPKVLFVAFLVLAIIVVLPLLRVMSSGNSSVDYKNLRLDLNIFNSIGVMLEELSTVKTDTFVYNYFNSSNYWHGANFLNLFTIAIPSSVYPNKPCIDDGIYLCNLMSGYVVSPNAGRVGLAETYSWPFTTPGCMFANFGIIGIIVGGIILGVIFRKAYKLLKRKCDPFVIFIYFLVIYQLEFSTLSISQAIVPIVFCGVTYYFCVKYTGRIQYKFRIQHFSS